MSEDRRAARRRFGRIGILLAVVAVPFVVAVAYAVDPVPQPSSCAGLAAPDDAGDQAIDLTPGPRQAAPDNTDITGVFFRYAKNSAGTRVLTANIRVKNLDKTLFTGSPSTEWMVHYNPTGTADDPEGTDRIAGARVDAQQQVHFWDGSAYIDVEPTPSGTATGQLHEGPNGVIEIAISTSNGFAGSTLSRVYAETLVKTTPTNRNGPAYIVDAAPEYGSDGAPTFGKMFKVEPCLADEGGSGTLPTVSIGSTSVTEGDSGTTTLSAPVTLSAPSAQTVTVKYATSDGTATKPADYTQTNSTVTIPAGQTSGTASVQVNGDTTDEPNETFTTTLSDPANATLATASQPQTITDDDAAPDPDPEPTPTPTPDPSPSPTPAPSAGSAPPANPLAPAGASGFASTRALRLTVRPRVVRASRARRGKRLRFAVSTREPLRKLTAALAKRSRVVGRARLARVSRRGTLRLKLTRRLRRGRYVLRLTATRADGSRGKLAVKIAVR